uniref:Membrane protein BRI3 n=1 Tax=Clastoptera arizonana TaxID=38151 RepID=A0A1B6DBQ6_9HEMI
MEAEKPPPYYATGYSAPSDIAQPPPGYIPYPTQPAYPPQVPSVIQPVVSGQPNYGATTITVQPEQVHNIIIVGVCPACRIGVLEDDYTCLGIFCAIFFFPLGILACLALKNRRCTNCGAYFG